jgi:hypothetical protein
MSRWLAIFPDLNARGDVKWEEESAEAMKCGTPRPDGKSKPATIPPETLA